MHEQGTVEAIFGAITPIAVANWPEHLALSDQLMCAGERQIQHAALEAFVSPNLRLCGVPDILVRCDIPSRFGSWSYSPIEVKHHREATSSDLLQLDAYRWLLGKVQGVVPPGELWLGSDIEGTPYKFHHSNSLDSFDTTVRDSKIINHPGMLLA
jgi:predicted RecB family nuclease